MSDKVRYEVAGRVATITIARPEVRNAMDLDVFAELFEAGRRAGDDPAVRAVVVTGASGAFSSGIDVSIFAAGSSNGSFEPASIDIPVLQRAFSIYEQIPKPVIAAVHGPAFGAGLQLAIACDLRVVAEGAELSVMETRWGIIPDLGATTRLPRLIGLGRARDLCYTGRRVGAEEASSMGLADRLVPAGAHPDAALRWAAELAEGPPLALAAIKRLTGAAFDTPVGTGLEREATAQPRMLASKDFIEAVSARFEKRDPRYEGM